MGSAGWSRFCGQLSGGMLSRRDGMIVARQFIAWNTPKKGEPSRRDGVSWATRHIRRPWSKNVLSTESYRSLRDGLFVWHTPGNKLPRYDHSVPPGQRPSTPVHEFDARSLQTERRLFEDEEDDEDENEVLGAINRQLPTANCQLPTANGQLPTANCQRPTANCQPPTANR